MSKRRVVITGLGTVNPIGNTIAEMRESLRQGKNGIAEITHYAHEDRAIHLAAEVKDLDLGEYFPQKELRRMDRFVALAYVAAKEAIEDSGIDFLSLQDSARVGVTLSSGIGGMETMEKDIQKASQDGFDRISPFFIPKVISNMAAAKIAMEFSLHGQAVCPVTACAGSTNALGEAFRSIRDGYLDLVVSGGAEATISEASMGGFTSMRALANTRDVNRASIPFDKERSGFVMGEGAGILLLEEYEHAKARKAKIYAELVGYGSSNDAYHITSPNPDGYWASQAMQMALDDAKIQAEEVSSINAHGTSTSLNDSCETKAIKLAFPHNWEKIKVNATKSMTGHLLGAAGAVEAIIACLELDEQFLAPTINYQVPDPECDLNLVLDEALETNVEYVMSNSLGFGGHNHSILLKRWIDEDAKNSTRGN